MALSGKGIFDKAKEQLMNGDLDLISDDIKIFGINAAGQAALTEATSDFVDDVAAGNRTHADGTAATLGIALGSKVVSGKNFDAANLAGTFTDPNNGNGDTVCIIIFKWDGVAESSSVLICYDELPSGVAQDGVNDNVDFDAGGIFDL